MSMTEIRISRTRYPLHAVAFVVGATLLCLAELTMMVLFIMPLLPLIPLVFIGILGHGSLLAAAVDYAQAQARVEVLPKKEAHLAPPTAHGPAPQPA
jgi:hypothetical protein